MSNFAKASEFGVAVTMLFFVATIVTSLSGHETVARALYWQDSLLQTIVPLHSIGLDSISLYASIPFGFIIYGTLAYIALHFSRRST
jgi:hypothetical protein